MEQSIKKAEALQEQLLTFAANTLSWAAKQQIPRSVLDQITRSCSSISANYVEALNASSMADFRNKIYISRKEAAETKNWIRLIIKLRPEAKSDDLLQECQHLLMIFQKITNAVNGQRSKPKE